MAINGMKAIEPVGSAGSGGSRSATNGLSPARSGASAPMGVTEAVSSLQQHLDSLSQGAQFSVDYLSGLDVVTVRDTNTGEIIRQVPGAEAVRLAQLLRKGDMSGATAFVDVKV